MERYDNLSLSDIEEILNDLTTPIKDKPVIMYINEGYGFIPFDRSEIFDKYIKEAAKGWILDNKDGR